MELIESLAKNSKQRSTDIANCLKAHVKIDAGRAYIWNPETKLFVAHQDVDNSVINAVGTYINDTLSKVLMKITKDASKKSVMDILSQDDILKKKQTVEDLLKTFTETGKIRSMLPYIIHDLRDPTFYERIDSDRQVINYKNGVLNLATGEFRERTNEDAFTKCLDYDYSTKRNEKVRTKVMTILRQICNDDPEFLEFMLCWLGYSITGETRETKIMCLMGRLASNGKSTILKILLRAFPIYVEKVDQDIVNENKKNAHKFLINCEKPTRVVFIEEVDNKKLSASSLKDFSDGERIPCEILYDTNVKLAIQAKLWMVINGIPRFKTDKGINRRFLVSEFTNQFRDIDDPEYKPNTKGHYINDKTVFNLFDTLPYRLELINIMLEYSIKYYNSGLIIPKSIREQGQAVCDLNDDMQTFINDRFSISDNADDRVGKENFMGLYNEVFNCRTPWITILADAKRCNLVYDKEKRMGGVKGVFTNLKMNDDTDDNDDDEKQDKKKVVFEKVNVNKNVILQADPYENGVIQCDYKVEVNTKPTYKEDSNIAPVVVTKPTIKKKLNKETLGVNIISDLLS